MKKFLVITAIVIAGVITWYLASPLFISKEVNEALPQDLITSTVNEDQGVVEVDVINGDELIGFEAPGDIALEHQNVAGYPVVGTPGHTATGFVQVLETSKGTVIRYEDFETINGPDLYVYLANDLEAKDYVDLGRIKGTKGNINYEVPQGVNVGDYKYVMYWCKLFGVLFNYAELK